ncbi:MAG: hypothetical protein KDD22_07580 [Bdellovibrionales bacterium]|nr:hypothetical protein [Bdellovibrionales bacterium]
MKFGLGVAGAFTASKGWTQVCGDNTGEQALGPFFPQPGTPIDPIREDESQQTPIYLANDWNLTKVMGRRGSASGQVVYVKGVVTDRACKPLEGATLIIWQASESGRYNHRGDMDNADFEDPRTGKIIHRTLDPYFQSWGQTKTNAQGEYFFKTIVPGFYPADLTSKWYRPPHIHFMVSALGHPQLVTQMYFRSPEIADNDFIQELNSKDFILQSKSLTENQREHLVVEFQTGSFNGESNLLVGEFNLQMD